MDDNTWQHGARVVVEFLRREAVPEALNPIHPIRDIRVRKLYQRDEAVPNIDDLDQALHKLMKVHQVVQAGGGYTRYCCFSFCLRLYGQH